MKFSKYLSDVEDVGIRGKENIWVETVVPCHLGIFLCMCERESARTSKTTCNKYEPVPRRKTREMGAIYFKRCRHRIINEELVMIYPDCVSHSMVDQAGKLFMCDETVR